MKALLDASWLAYRSKYALGNLSHADLKTGVIYGFLEQVRHVCADPLIMSNRVGLFFDSRSSKRRAAFPTYKAKRRKDRSPEEWADHALMHDQLHLLRTAILPACGFRCYTAPGLESDDLIAKAADQIDSTGGETVIVTADGDLYQCIRNNTVSWYDPGRRLHLTYLKFWAKYDLDPRQWAEVKAIAGCKSDGVRGVWGMGGEGAERSATRYILGEYPRHHKRYQAITSAEGLATIQRNRGLVTLPHPDTPELDLAPPRYNEQMFWMVAHEHGFKSFLEGARRKAWADFFNAPGGDLGASRQIARKRSV